MRKPQAPKLDERRAPEFSAELQERARAWIPEWGLADGERDFGRALLEIAARFNSEVAERLDGAGEKMRRGFLDWLAVRREAARPARMPVVFKLADTAQEAVLASAPVRMQADADGTPVVFETEMDVRIVPGRLDVVVGVDADQDAFYLPPPGLSDLNPPEPLPTQWRLKSFAAAGATKLQLDPETGLADEMIIEAGGAQYRIDHVDNAIVTIDPALDSDLAESTTVRKVVSFAPFGSAARNRQEHALYLGHMDILNIKAAATIDVVGASALGSGITWQYWGKVDGGDEEDWRPLTMAPPNEQRPGAVVLKKPKGEISPHKIGATNSRWIRAYTKKVEGAAPALQVDTLEIRINCGSAPPPCPLGTAIVEASPEAEAMANTTPLVLDKVLFFPLGKEPRQFDAFYLGSQEAFSKKGAAVQLCFEMAEPSFAALSSLRAGPQADKFLAGVAANGYLHLLRFDPASGVLSLYPNRGPMQPPSPGPFGVTIDSAPVSLDPLPGFRAPIWALGASVFVAVTSKNAVWIWREDQALQPLSGWESAGSVGSADPAKPIDGLVYLEEGPAGRLFALRDSKLFVRNLNSQNPTWEPVNKQGGGAEIALKKIAPIAIRGGGFGPGTLTEGMIGVDGTKLYGITFAGSPLEAIYQELRDSVGSDLTPAAVRRKDTDDKLVVVAIGQEQPNSDRKLLAFLSKPGTGNFDEDGTDEASLDSRNIVGHSIDVNQNGGQLTFVTCVRVPEESTSLAAWAPFETAGPAVLFSTKIPPHIDAPGGAPTLLAKHVIAPTTSSHVIVAPFDVSRRLTLKELMQTAVITSNQRDQLLNGDQLAISFDDNGPTKYEIVVITGPGIERRGQTLHAFDVRSINTNETKFFVYRAAGAFAGTIGNPFALDELTIDFNDSSTRKDTVLLINTDAFTEVYTVADFDPAQMLATLDRPLNIANPALPVIYRVPDVTQAELRPLLSLNPLTKGNWQAALLDRVRLLFPGADPAQQYGIAFTIDLSGRPELVALRERWDTAPADVGTVAREFIVEFIVDASVGDWSVQLGSALSNPELSWEYWNGKGWWGLGATDNTQHLRTTGAVRFEAPSDIAPSDWAGKTNFWIRARLVGGDYGREKVTVKTKDVTGGTEQTVDRSSEGIRAPSVLKLHISYTVCKSVKPTLVLTEDSGVVRDQSDANSTAGAIVEAFVPLAVSLGRLSKTASPDASDECPPECDCQARHAGAGAAAATAPQASPASSALAMGRALFIGLDATPSGAPVNALLLVEEQNHTAFAPMKIEALVTDHFKPIVADDTTRALGESGLLSMSFAIPPTRSDLFGRTGLTWLRLTPKESAEGEWKPTLLGAYLNAAWASATETLTRELLGSSDGSPNLTVRLARPPVLRNTLELRVMEPLGEEEREALLKKDVNSVLSAVDGLPGDWVLWKKVIDPDDEPATERVYALDEAGGEIRFGNGLHGAIPPIGRDSIVAFSYCRTEADPKGGDSVPGNAITARTALNLVSPVETVESVIAADQAAGGAPPESDERTLRFGFARLRHRNRAVTAEDIEDLALQSSPDIVQALAVLRRGYVRLVVVMRGKNPRPNAAQVRELRRLLLASAPVSLSAPKALRIEGPNIRRLRIELQLRVETLAEAGELAEFVKERLAGFFDTATGGIDKDGWPLGVNPSKEDITFALIDAPHLESIADVTLLESVDDGKVRAWPETLKATEIVMLADDPIRIDFKTKEEPV